MMDTGSLTGANDIPTWVWFFLAGVVGLVTSIAFVYITQYYTAGGWRPVKEIAEASKTGPATNIISGIVGGHGDDLRHRHHHRHRARSPATGWVSRRASSTRTAATSAASSAPPWRPWACS